MKAAELLVKCLENEGVEYIFGIPGEENIDIMDALLDSRIKFVTTRHEQGAAFMADVYGRLTGRAGVCMATLGPGATNLITGFADANMDRAPIVGIAGQGATTRLHKESHQILNLVKHCEEKEKAAHPMQRLMAIEETGDGVLVTTTDVHLARNIAERVHDSYKGDLAFHYNKEDNLLRANWKR